MKSNVIYYPYMRMPNDEWFSQVALYWDKLYTMTTSYHSNSWKFPGTYEEKLVRSKLVETINIKEHLGERDKLEKFLEYVDSPDYPIPHDKNKWEASERMFHEKMEWDSEIFRGLRERGLVSERAIDGWYEVEAYTAKQYMAYLAAAIGEDREINANAITDRQANLESFIESNEQKNAPEKKTIQVSNIVLNKILPSPGGRADPELIARFKKNNQEELFNFREHLQHQIRQIAAIDDHEDQKDSIEYLIKEEQTNINELEEKMKANGWRNIIRNNWKTLSVPLVGVALSPFTGGLSLLSTLYGYGAFTVDEHFKKKNKSELFRKDKHFYLVSAKHEFEPNNQPLKL
jgi:hypothetical protein